MEMDHPESFSEAGPIDPLHAQGLCRTCHREKGNMGFSDWVDFVLDVVEW